MGFLQPYMANKSREGNLQEDDEDETQHFEEYLTSAEVVSETIEEVNTQQEDKSVEDETQQQKLPETVRAATPTASATPKSKKIKKDNVTALLKQSMEKREERAKARSEERRNMLQDLKPTQNDPLFHFFMSMYHSTKRMPPSYQHTVRARVFNAVSEVEAKLLDISTYANQQQPGPTQQEPSPTQQQTYYQYVHPGPATIQSYSSSSSTTAYLYSDNSLLSPGDTREEHENPSTTAASSVNLFNYITTFSEK